MREILCIIYLIVKVVSAILFVWEDVRAFKATESCTEAVPGPAQETRNRRAVGTQRRRAALPGLRRQLEREQITEQIVHLCFTCDPYPTILEDESGTKREVIQVLKEYGNNVQILTRETGRLADLGAAKEKGIQT